MVKWVAVFAAIVFLLGLFIPQTFSHWFSQTAVSPPQEDDSVIQTWRKADEMANQFAYMNFLLTLLSLLGTVGGLAFTIYGYYLSKEVPNIVEDLLDNRVKEYETELEQRLNHATQALELLLEDAILKEHVADPLLSPMQSTSSLATLLEAEKLYSQLRGLHFYKAVFTWNEARNRTEAKREAIQWMNLHLKKNSQHARAYLFLISWHLNLASLEPSHYRKALQTLEFLLEKFPEYCYHDLLIQAEEWYRSEEKIKERNLILFEAEKKVYERQQRLEEFWDWNQETRLENLLEDARHNLTADDIPVFSEEIYRRKFYASVLKESSFIQPNA